MPLERERHNFGTEVTAPTVAFQRLTTGSRGLLRFGHNLDDDTGSHVDDFHGPSLVVLIGGYADRWRTYRVLVEFDKVKITRALLCPGPIRDNGPLYKSTHDLQCQCNRVEDVHKVVDESTRDSTEPLALQRCHRPGARGY